MLSRLSTLIRVTTIWPRRPATKDRYLDLAQLFQNQKTYHIENSLFQVNWPAQHLSASRIEQIFPLHKAARIYVFIECILHKLFDNEFLHLARLSTIYDNLLLQLNFQLKMEHGVCTYRKVNMMENNIQHISSITSKYMALKKDAQQWDIFKSERSN